MLPYPVMWDNRRCFSSQGQYFFYVFEEVRELHVICALHGCHAIRLNGCTSRKVELGCRRFLQLGMCVASKGDHFLLLLPCTSDATASAGEKRKNDDTSTLPEQLRKALRSKEHDTGDGGMLVRGDIHTCGVSMDIDVEGGASSSSTTM